MTERGLPLADGASACPFVAFEDDRDERASVPDHRHRCYAEAQPAPRALAHQEAYCLSSAFPVCPTFQDWARREAARARGGAPSGRPHPDDREDAAAAGLAMAAAAAAEIAGPDDPDGPGRRRAPDPDRADERSDSSDRDSDDREPDDHIDDHTDEGPDQVRRNPPRDWSAPPPWLASAESGPRGDDAGPPAFLGRRVDPGQGLAGSAADRLAGGRPASRDDDDEAAWVSSGGPPEAGAGGSRTGRSGQAHPLDEEAPDEEPRRPVRRPRAYDQHLGGPDGPDWERPRRYEAYPTIKSRVGLPSMPRLAVTAAVVAVAALALFFLPAILSLGGPSAPTGSTAPSASVRASVAPTVPPAPTPMVYTIKRGDTLSKIAAANGLTIEDILAANPTIKDPNKIALGQQIIIPTPSEEPPNEIGGSAEPSVEAP